MYTLDRRWINNNAARAKNLPTPDVLRFSAVKSVFNACSHMELHHTGAAIAVTASRQADGAGVHAALGEETTWRRR
jgi:hypothetical protein